MRLDALLEKLWRAYAAMNPQAEAIHAALEARGEKVVNDHIAFRTFDIPSVNIDRLAKPFLDLGYVCQSAPYLFPEKKLTALHYEHPDPDRPRIFISELKTQSFSASLQRTVAELVEQVPPGLSGTEDFLFAGTPWPAISRGGYQALKAESEYAAWMAAFGFRVNHFTVSFNALKSFADLAALNKFIKKQGFLLNRSGGEIKGTPEDFLEQSSTLAAETEVIFSDRAARIPGCYYEFARRYPGPEGLLFQGFLTHSADRIFESTDNPEEGRSGDRRKE